MKWFWFAIVQLISLVATVLGWVVLIPFCLGRLWLLDMQTKSIKDARFIDTWDLPIIQAIYGNREDGVSGQQAIVFTTGVAGSYMPGAWAPWRAYRWSALRNSCNGLKYMFADPNGPPALEIPYRLLWIWPRTLKVGYQNENGFNVPVMSP